jgi:N-acylneuraminate cytidylyltransferase
MSAFFTAFIFARGGSKGLPGKNVKPLAGKPLIGWAIGAALAVPDIGRVIVSTDDEGIASVARAYGAQVPFMRPADLASDTAPEWLSWRHALQTLKEIEGTLPDPFISVPTTSPLRLPDDIEACISAYQFGGAEVVLAVTEAHRNPWFNMVNTCIDGTVKLVNNPDGSVSRRQDAPSVLDLTTVAYVANPLFVLEQQGMFSGRVKAVTVPVDRSIDIDTPHDFAIAEFLMRKRLGLT